MEKFYRRFVCFKDTVSFSDEIVMFSHMGKQMDILKFMIYLDHACLRLITTRIFFLFYFLRNQNSQHFNEDLLGVNASAFSFVLCFKAADYAGASNYVISAN